MDRKITPEDITTWAARIELSRMSCNFLNSLCRLFNGEITVEELRKEIIYVAEYNGEDDDHDSD